MGWRGPVASCGILPAPPTLGLLGRLAPPPPRRGPSQEAAERSAGSGDQLPRAGTTALADGKGHRESQPTRHSDSSAPARSHGWGPPVRPCNPLDPA